MKQDTLQSLLDKYREGTLSDSERSELERLSHKEEVFSAARHQAAGIMRRRVALAVSALMVCGAGIWALQSGVGRPEPQVAEVIEPMPKVQQEVLETLVPEAIPEPAPLVAEARVKPIPQTHSDATIAPMQRPKPADVTPITKPSDEPVVMCNNQCDADSVINDIRKFLAYEGI